MNHPWCRHYTGVLHTPVCEAGVAYETVKDASTRPTRWLCTDADAQATCPQLSRYTPAEEDAFNAAITRSLQRQVELIAAGRCPECEQPMQKKQVGRCVYAMPCRHRLYQGRV